jgi:hypothetical protein
MPFRRSRPLPPILFSFISPAKRGWLDYRFGRASKPNLEKNLSNRVKRAAGGKQAACASSASSKAPYRRRLRKAQNKSQNLY